MAPQNQSQNSDKTLGFLVDLIRHIRLLWRLLNDPRVPAWVKTIPTIVLLYLIFPIDLMPDPVLGLGQLDDLAIILLGLKIFRDFSPPFVVREHEADIAGRSSPWQVVEDVPTSEQETHPPCTVPFVLGPKDPGLDTVQCIDAEYEVVDKD